MCRVVHYIGRSLQICANTWCRTFAGLYQYVRSAAKHSQAYAACPRIHNGGGGKNMQGFFFAFQFSTGGSAQKIAGKLKFPTKIVAKYR